jgi:lipopolysaccharide export system permease protein
MRLLDRYIIRSVLAATALGLAVLLVLMALFLYVNEQGWVGVGRYGNLQAVRHVLLNLPATLLPFLPVAALFGALLAVGQLARGAELTVMRAAGVPVARIGAAVFAAGLLLLPLALLVSEWVAPPLVRVARETRALERDGGISLTRQGVWLRDGARILRADGAGSGGVMLFELGDGQVLEAVTRAGAVRALPGGGWELDGASGSRLGDRSVMRWSAATQPLQLAAGTEFFNTVSSEPREMSLAALARAVDSLRASGLDVRRHRFAFWAGIARLAAIPLAMLLAVPLLFGALRGAENAARATVGLVLGLAWYIAQRMVENGALAFDLSPPLLALLPTLVLAAAVVVLLARLPRISAG